MTTTTTLGSLVLLGAPFLQWAASAPARTAIFKYARRGRLRHRLALLATFVAYVLVACASAYVLLGWDALGAAKIAALCVGGCGLAMLSAASDLWSGTWSDGMARLFDAFFVAHLEAALLCGFAP